MTTYVAGEMWELTDRLSATRRPATGRFNYPVLRSELTEDSTSSVIQKTSTATRTMVTAMMTTTTRTKTTMTTMTMTTTTETARTTTMSRRLMPALADQLRSPLAPCPLCRHQRCRHHHYRQAPFRHQQMFRREPRRTPRRPSITSPLSSLGDRSSCPSRHGRASALRPSSAFRSRVRCTALHRRPACPTS